MVQLAQEQENQVKLEDSLCKELQTLCDEEEDTRSWIQQLRENLESLDVTSSIQERMNRIEVIKSKKLLQCGLDHHIYLQYVLLYDWTFSVLFIQ